MIVVLVLATFLRFWSLGNVPPSASLDEASIGYNAYSVLKTGGDEYGEFPFISQRGYDDFRRSTYLFLTIPFISLFGLNVVSVRLPAVILSILTVWATYHIVLLLFSKRSEFSSNVALLASFLLAISPWHIYISRLGHESNACLAFLVFGVLFFLKGVNQNSFGKVLLSMIFFTLSMVSYYSGQAFIPLFVVGLFFIFRKNLVSIITENKKNFISFFILLILIIPILGTIFSREAIIRYQGTSILSPGATWQESHVRERLYNNAVQKNDLIKRIYYSEKIYSVKLLIKGYFSHFNIKWLFVNTGNEPFKIPGLGLLYVWELPLIVVGIIYLLRMKEDQKSKKLIIYWFLIAPVSAALATGAPHAMRSYNFLPTWQIFAAFGLAYLFYKMQEFRILFFSAFVLLILVSVSTFYKNYFVVFPKEQSSSFQYALGKSIDYVEKIKSKYKKIVFSNKENLYQSYMYYLFHTNYDPVLYKKEDGTISGGFRESHRFGNLVFMPIDSGMRLEKNVLYIVNSDELKLKLNTLVIFRNLDGRQAVKGGIAK